MFQNSLYLGAEIAQSPRAIPFWETVLNSINFERIIELGTWKGNFSVFLLQFCLQKGAEFYTFDKVVLWQAGGLKELKSLLDFEKYFRHEDIFLAKGLIQDLIKAKGRTLLICDDGDKPREFKTFSAYLKPGDVIAVHDFGQEIYQIDLQPVCQKFLLKEIFRKESKIEGYTKIFQKSCLTKNS